MPAYVADTAQRARRRILAAGLPCVLGHADFEAQNLRWHGQQVWAVHDWDSLAWQPEAALAGVASGSFASSGPPALASVESSKAFLVACQDIRGRMFTGAEQEIAWAASVVDGGVQRTRKHCTATPRSAAMRSAHKQPNASAGLTPSTSMRAQRTPYSGRNVRALAGLKGYVTNPAACPDGAPVTGDFMISACHRLS